MDKIVQRNTERRRTDPGFHVKMNLRSRLGSAIRGRYKSGSAVSDLGCSIEKFLQYIGNLFLPGMTWENYGKWHLDHIVPLCAFDLTNRTEFLKASHYSNYQPLWASDNCRKNRYDNSRQCQT